jgi:hypothetical protein
MEAMGLPQCAPVPERIRRVMFTTDLEPLAADSIGDLFTNPAAPWASSPWPDLWKLTTPLLDDATSEKGEDVREEVGGAQFFVRESNRTFSAVVVRRPAEFGRLIKQLRCAQQLGAFLVDAAGVVWGMRVGVGAFPVHDIAPIPVLPATVSARAQFASANTVWKWEFSFEFSPAFRDELLVPVWAGEEILNYQPPIHLYASVIGVGTPNRAVTVQAIFARGPQEVFIPFTQPITPPPRYFDASGNDLGPVAEFANPANIPTTGTWIIPTSSIPTGAAYIAFTPAQLAGTIAPTGYNWYDFRIDL